jgi:predicted RNase H-like nuclease
MNIDTTLPTVYLGLDLAWSSRNPSGFATCVGTPAGAQLVQPPSRLLTNDAIVQTIRTVIGDAPAILAIDAPLVVPNETGRRTAEAELAAAFRRYDAGPHPANRRLLARYGGVRGEALLAALAVDGFVYTAAIEAGMSGRFIIEVFPHPATVVLFRLPHILRYKARPGRALAERRRELERYLSLLRGLSGGDPPLFGSDELWHGIDLDQLSPRSLKAVEDEADALLCAYIALYGHRWGATRCRSYGTLEGGAIFTPDWSTSDEY